MFYGADDIATALKEVAHDSKDTYVTYAQFELSVAIPVVDLTSLPAEPSMFDPKLGAMRRQIRFLHMFVDQLSSRVPPSREQIEYVPTQIVCEYLLHIHGGGNRARGLIYHSSLSKGKCVALNILNDHCIDRAADAPEDDVCLKLLTDSVASLPISEVDGYLSLPPTQPP